MIPFSHYRPKNMLCLAQIVIFHHVARNCLQPFLSNEQRAREGDFCLCLPTVRTRCSLPVAKMETLPYGYSIEHVLHWP